MLGPAKFGYLILVSTILGQPMHNEIRVKERLMVKSAELVPMKASHEEHRLMKMSLQERRTLCEIIKAKVEGPIFPPSEAAYYVLLANMYKFKYPALTKKDKTEHGEEKEDEALAVLCPFVPPFFVSDAAHVDMTSKKIEHWYIVRAVQPVELKSYRFQVEKAGSVVPQTNSGKFSPANRWFYFLEFEERWRICINAVELIKRELADKSVTTVGQPALHKFSYGNRQEIFLAYQCHNHVYLRTNHSETNDEIIISFVK